MENYEYKINIAIVQKTKNSQKQIATAAIYLIDDYKSQQQSTNKPFLIRGIDNNSKN